MFESADGRSVACTRQNPGKSVSGWPGPPPRAGATNAPGATGCAIVIVVLGSANDDRLSQVAASATPLKVNPTSPNAIARCLWPIRADYTKVPGSRFQVRGSRFEVRGSRFEVRGSTG